MYETLIYLIGALGLVLGAFFIIASGFINLKKDPTNTINIFFAFGFFCLALNFILSLPTTAYSANLITINRSIISISTFIAIVFTYIGCYFLILTGKSLKYGKISILSKDLRSYQIPIPFIIIISIIILISNIGNSSGSLNPLVAIVWAVPSVFYAGIFVYDLYSIYTNVSLESENDRMVKKNIRAYLIAIVSLGILSAIGWPLYEYTNSVYYFVIPSLGTFFSALTFFITSFLR